MSLYDVVTVRRSLSPLVRANGTASGAAVNLGISGSDSAIVAVVTGLITDGSHAVSVEESDTGTGAWTAIPVGRLSGALPTMTATDDDTQFEIGVVAGKQFLRAVVTTTGATTGGLFAAVIATGEPGITPVSHA